ncbi:hypothetical protein ABET51_16110 [Metabacillus fastidiosus]|uniref:hypothetical protein n=1 Tax=Metabacillus fastidiosus TaxID=1458 RepID=UPI003D2B37F1
MEKHLSKIIFLMILTVGISLFILFTLEEKSFNSFEEIETVELPPLEPLDEEVESLSPSEILVKTNETVKEQEVITIDKMNDNNSGRLFVTGKEEIKIIKDVIHGVIKQPGVVNMAEPQYRIESGGEIYHLWFAGLDGTIGTIMNVKDPNTI